MAAVPFSKSKECLAKISENIQLTPSSVTNDAVCLHSYDAGGERIGLGAVVCDIDGSDAQMVL
jgi:hypothetical protein